MTVTRIYLAVAVACGASCTFGYGTGYIGGILALPSFNHHFGLDRLSRGERAAAQSLVVSIWLVGAFLGVIFALPVCSQLGRRRCLGISAAVYVVGAVLQLVPAGHSMSLFNIGRLLNGLGVGASTLATPLYIAEISPAELRGMFMGAFQATIQISALIGFWGAYVSHHSIPNTSVWQWKVPIVLQLVFGVPVLFGHLPLPETPVWLAENVGVDAVTEALAWLRHETAQSPAVQEEAKTLHQTVLERRRMELLEPPKSLWVEVKRASIRKRLFCGIGMMALMTLSGTNALNFFTPIIFQSAGFTSTSASLFLTGLFGLSKLLASLTLMFYVVRVRGHRFWIMLASGVCTVSLLVLAFCVRSFDAAKATTADEEELSSYTVPGIVACLMVFVFAFFFGLGHGPLSWNICAEIFPPHISTACCTITTSTQWFFQIINAMLTPFLLNSAGWVTWLIFAGVNAFTLIWCMVYLPETKGVSPGKDMDSVFGGDKESPSDNIQRGLSETAPLLVT